jgi:hypothetical protein
MDALALVDGFVDERVYVRERERVYVHGRVKRSM